MYVYVCVCIYVCFILYICKTHIRHTRTRTCARTHTDRHTHTHERTYIHTYTSKVMDAHTKTLLRTQHVPLMVLSIQSTNDLTRAYTVGLSGKPHNIYVQLVMPCNIHGPPPSARHTRGPPESPLNMATLEHIDHIDHIDNIGHIEHT